MVTEQLVTSEVEAGLRLLRALDECGFGAKAAFWLYSSERESWRFVIGVDADPEDLSRQYHKASAAIAAWRNAHPESLPLLDLWRVRFVQMSDPLVLSLATVVPTEAVGETRVSNNYSNGVFVEDALVHRIAA